MATRDEAVHPYTPYGLPALVPSRRGWQRTELDRIRANASVKVVDLTGSDPADPILGREAAGDNLARIYRSSAVAKGNSAKTYSKGADVTGASARAAAATTTCTAIRKLLSDDAQTLKATLPARQIGSPSPLSGLPSEVVAGNWVVDSAPANSANGR
ncbi:hypothetical protein K432DRAFT_470260 [Lepidopterella palustris CBS 459.81]|uniref:Uncharacterized protein n=1 Tax=Lepidopterella palustris CBS 459.81 TaxID=1314670 RepID=A0A8E2DYW5_9PEZI|nr:hypothetical protein K432DRAFT_470260 [Lepidopterella palustris CBS 459.81]